MRFAAASFGFGSRWAILTQNKNKVCPMPQMYPSPIRVAALVVSPRLQLIYR